jgi:hypothetical protein
MPAKEKFMQMSYTSHAEIRSQQRGIPPLISNWLLDYGDEIYDGHGGVVRCFTPSSIRAMEREIGRAPLKRMSEFLRCYLVQSSRNGAVITLGKRHQNKHIWRH